jgi:hypothetical protein
MAKQTLSTPTSRGHWPSFPAYPPLQPGEGRAKSRHPPLVRCDGINGIPPAGPIGGCAYSIGQLVDRLGRIGAPRLKLVQDFAEYSGGCWQIGVHWHPQKVRLARARRKPGPGSRFIGTGKNSAPRSVNSFRADKPAGIRPRHLQFIRGEPQNTIGSRLRLVWRFAIRRPPDCPTCNHGRHAKPYGAMEQSQ